MKTSKEQQMHLGLYKINPMQWAHIDSWRNFHKNYGERLSGNYYYINRNKGYRTAKDTDPEDRVYTLTHQITFPQKSWEQMARETSRRRKLNPNWNDQNQ